MKLHEPVDRDTALQRVLEQRDTGRARPKPIRIATATREHSPPSRRIPMIIVLPDSASRCSSSPSASWRSSSTGRRRLRLGPLALEPGEALVRHRLQAGKSSDGHLLSRSRSVSSGSSPTSSRRPTDARRRCDEVASRRAPHGQPSSAHNANGREPGARQRSPATRRRWDEVPSRRGDREPPHPHPRRASRSRSDPDPTAEEGAGDRVPAHPDAPCSWSGAWAPGAGAQPPMAEAQRAARTTKGGPKDALRNQMLDKPRECLSERPEGRIPATSSGGSRFGFH